MGFINDQTNKEIINMTRIYSIERQKSMMEYFDLDKPQREVLKSMTDNGTYDECIALLTRKRLNNEKRG